MEWTSKAAFQEGKKRKKQRQHNNKERERAREESLIIKETEQDFKHTTYYTNILSSASDPNCV